MCEIFGKDWDKGRIMVISSLIPVQIDVNKNNVQNNQFL